MIIFNKVEQGCVDRDQEIRNNESDQWKISQPLFAWRLSSSNCVTIPWLLKGVY